MVTSVCSFYTSRLALKIQWLNWWIACWSHLQNVQEALLNSCILEKLVIFFTYLLAHLSLLTWIKEVGGCKREQQGLENLFINIQSIIRRWWYKNCNKCSSVLLYIDMPDWSKSATTNTRNITTLLNVTILRAPMISFEFLQSFWVFLAVSRIKLSVAGICNHLLIPAKIALESCCLSYFVCTLALLSTCQSYVSLNCEPLFVLNAATWMVLDSFFSLAFQTTVKFPHPVSNFRELLSCFFLFCLISLENLQWHPIFRNKLVRSTNSTLQTVFHYYLR